MTVLAADDAPTAMDWGALATALGAAIALAVGILTVLQKARTDRRSEWWLRAQWSIDNATGTRDETVEAGLISMAYLIESPLATDDEVRLVRDLAENIAEREP